MHPVVLSIHVQRLELSRIEKRVRQLLHILASCQIEDYLLECCQVQVL